MSGRKYWYGRADDRFHHLVHAVLADNEAAVKQVLDDGADVNATNADGETAFSYACANDKFRMARLLYELGARIDTIDKGGGSPLDWADSHASREFIEWLVGIGSTRAAGGQGECRCDPAKHQDDRAVRKRLAMGLFNGLHDAAPAEQGEFLDELRKLAAKPPDDPAILELLAKGLAKALHDAAPAEQGEFLDELRKLAAEHPDSMVDITNSIHDQDTDR